MPIAKSGFPVMEMRRQVRNEWNCGGCADKEPGCQKLHGCQIWVMKVK